MAYIPQLSGKYDMNIILSNIGVRVGKGTIFYDPRSMNIDRERPWMLKIGEYCKICAGTIILTHDYSRSVLRRRYGDIVGESGLTLIGDNCFIGMNSIILMGSQIGNNVIVGAGSVVSGKIPDNVVVAGNPARVVCTLDEFYKKRKAANLDAGCLYYNTFHEFYKRPPTPKEMGPFFTLFADRNKEYLDNNQIYFSLNGDNVEEALNSFYLTEKMFDNYTQFSEYAVKHK